MTIFLLRPSASRRVMWAWVGACQRSRLMMITWSAQFAWRSPYRFSRWWRCRPDDASIGETPQSAANDDDERSRSGLSPAAASSSRDLGADSVDRPQRRGSSRGEVVELRVELDELVVQVLPAASDRAQREARSLERWSGR